MGFRRAERERRGKRPPQDAEEWRKSPVSPNAVIQLQRMIGNQAVQRLISHDRRGVLRRDSEGQKKYTVLATITFAKAGKLKGNSKIAGHEGKIEIHSIQIDPSSTKRTNETAPPLPELIITRTSDDLSPRLMQANVEGDTITAAQFEFLRYDDKGKTEVVRTMEFSDGYITSFSVSGGGPDMTEQIGLEFKHGSF